MSKQRYVSFFQSPSTGMRRAIIWSGLPKKRIELKIMIVDQIAQNNLLFCLLGLDQSLV